MKGGLLLQVVGEREKRDKVKKSAFIFAVEVSLTHTKAQVQRSQILGMECFARVMTRPMYLWRDDSEIEGWLCCASISSIKSIEDNSCRLRPR